MLTYPLKNAFYAQAMRRLDYSPLGNAYPGGNWIPGITFLRFTRQQSLSACSGPVSRSWVGKDTVLIENAPFALRYTAQSDGSPDWPRQLELFPGADPRGRDSASLILAFSTANAAGCFEVDSACYSPGGHLNFFDINGEPVPVAFTKGTICIDPSCYHCYCLGNPHNCPGGDVDIIDVLQTVNVAFRQQGLIPDPSVVCPYSDTDLNCDGVTNVLDLTGIIQVAFGGQPLQSVACNPCP